MKPIASHSYFALTAVLLLALFLSACTPPSPPVKETGARVFFTNLTDGATVSSPLKVTVGA